jgi:hypothetical protein
MSFTDEELALMALDASLHQSEETRTILALVAEVQYLRRLLLVREQQTDTPIAVIIALTGEI